MPLGGTGHLGDHISHAPRAKPWHYATELFTISVTYPLCGSALSDTTICLTQIKRLPGNRTDFTYRLIPQEAFQSAIPYFFYALTLPD